MSRNLPNPAQADLFEKPVFESRSCEPIDFDLFRLRIKTAMALALGECGISRDEIAAQVSSMAGIGTMSRAMLDAYTSPAKNHDISLVRFKALARVTGASNLWDQAVSDDGLIVLEGDEARLAEIARLQQMQRKFAQELKVLRAVPVEIRRMTK